MIIGFGCGRSSYVDGSVLRVAVDCSTGALNPNPTSLNEEQNAEESCTPIHKT